MADVSKLMDEVNEFLIDVRKRAQDGLTWTEFGALTLSLMHLIVDGLDAVDTMTGPQKKEIVMTAVATLFDSFADACVPLPLYPVWVLAKPAVRSLVLALASGALESLLPIARKAVA